MGANEIPVCQEPFFPLNKLLSHKSSQAETADFYISSLGACVLTLQAIHKTNFSYHGGAFEFDLPGCVTIGALPVPFTSEIPHKNWGAASCSGPDCLCSESADFSKHYLML